MSPLLSWCWPIPITRTQWYLLVAGLICARLSSRNFRLRRRQQKCARWQPRKICELEKGNLFPAKLISESYRCRFCTALNLHILKSPFSVITLRLLVMVQCNKLDGRFGYLILSTLIRIDILGGIVSKYQRLVLSDDQNIVGIPALLSTWRRREMQSLIRGGADKSLVRPGRKQATATKLGTYSTYPPWSSIHSLARCSKFCKPLKKKFRMLSVQPSLRGSNDLSVGEKWRPFYCFFSPGNRW